MSAERVLASAILVLLAACSSTGDGEGVRGTEVRARDGGGRAELRVGDEMLVHSEGASSLAAFAGREARGETVIVAVVSEHSAWVGSGERGRNILVHFASGRIEGTAGTPVYLVGIMTPLTPGTEPGLGMTRQDDVARLRKQGHYIEASEMRTI